MEVYPIYAGIDIAGISISSALRLLHRREEEYYKKKAVVHTEIDWRLEMLDICNV